jgi:hypothetical protein
VAGIRTWNSLGRFVKRGEKGILIPAPMISRKKTDDVTESTADAKEATAQLYGFRAVYVFDRLSRDLWLSLCAPSNPRAPTLGGPLNSSGYIIAQFFGPVQRCFRGQAISIFVYKYGVLRAMAC